MLAIVAHSVLGNHSFEQSEILVLVAIVIYRTLWAHILKRREVNGSVYTVPYAHSLQVYIGVLDRWCKFRPHGVMPLAF